MTNPHHDRYLARVVVDPGVLVSALISPQGGGAPAHILSAWLDRRFVPIISEQLLDELYSVLLRPKFRRYVSQEQVDKFTDLLRQSSVVFLEAPSPLDRPTADPGDDYLVALAIAAQADVLVSGDAHLSSYSHDAIVILTPRQFVEQLAN